MPALARWLLGLGIVATLAANVAHGLGHGIIGAAVAAWPAVAPPQLWIRSSRSVCSYTRSWASWSRDFLDDFLSSAEL